MSESDGASAGVYVLNTETENLSIGLDNSCKSLVELPDRDIGFREAGLLEELLNNSRRCDGEVDRV
jgi:hypothetical protein